MTSELKNFEPWDSAGDRLYFDCVGSGGEVINASVTRACLIEFKLANFESTTRQEFARGKIAEKLRNMARGKVNRGEEPDIGIEDWERWNG